ncbi:MAG: enoyl-CoA hydratase-related protein [Microthrixaceae bacterium]
MSEPGQFRHIRYEVRGHTATITLDRPDRLNAFTPRMASELIAAFDLSDADDAVRGVVVTGDGRAFCAGADLGMGGETFDLTDAAAGGERGVEGVGFVGEGDERAPADLGGVVVLRIHRSLKPVVAAINGPAVGVGLTMTLPMDVRLAVAGSKLAVPFVRRGIATDGCASWFLPRVVGVSTALEWVSTGRTFRAEEALAAGLVRTVYEDRDTMLSAAEDLVAEIAESAAPVSVTVSRQLIAAALASGGPEEAHARESLAIYRRGRSGDAREGVTSFIEKRAAEFPDSVSTSDEV